MTDQTVKAEHTERWVCVEGYSAPKNAPVSVFRVKGLAEGAAARVVAAFHEALDRSFASPTTEGRASASEEETPR